MIRVRNLLKLKKYQDFLADRSGIFEEQVAERTLELAAANSRLYETQEKLIQSDRLASIGQLAAGVAHEINNPIGYVHSNIGSLEAYLGDLFRILDAYAGAEHALAADLPLRAELLRIKAELDLDFLREDIPKLMAESKEGISRVRKIVQDLKDFSHVDSSQEWKLADLHAGLNSTLNVVTNEIKYKAEVVKDYGTIPEIECLPSQLNQVFLNLLVNAAHATVEGGAARSPCAPAWTTGQGVGRGRRQRQRHRAGEPEAHLRPLLHHQAGRQGHRPRAVAVLRHRAEAPRPHRGGQRTG